MERINNLNRYQKGILLVLVAMAVLFAAVYGMVISRTGYLYSDRILEQGTENGNTVYRAEVGGVEWCFTVTPEKTVTFRYGAREYGPYTAKEDPTAVPKNHDMAEYMTGVEVREKDKVIFRGGILPFGGADPHWMMFDEHGDSNGFAVNGVMSNGTVIDGNGQIVDPMEPSVSDVLRLMEGPELSHKGDWYGWLLGVVISLVAIVSLLFADELFRFYLLFRVRDAYLAEPSDWEIAGRYIGWTAWTVMALVAYIMGLQ